MKIKLSITVAVFSCLLAFNSFGATPSPRMNGGVLFRENVVSHNGIGIDISDNLSTVVVDNITASEMPSVNTIYITDPDDSQTAKKVICDENLYGWTLYPNADAEVRMVRSKEDENNGRSQETSGFWSKYATNIIGSSVILGVAYGAEMWGAVKTMWSAGLKGLKSGGRAKHLVVVLALVAYNMADVLIDVVKGRWYEDYTASMQGEIKVVQGPVKFACTADRIGPTWMSDMQDEKGTTYLVNAYTGTGSKYYLDVGTKKVYTDFVFAKTGAPEPVATSLCDTKHWPTTEGTCLPRTAKCQIHPYLQSKNRFVSNAGQESGAPIGYEEASLCPTWNGSEFRYSNSENVRFYDDDKNPLLSSNNRDFAEQVKRTERLIEQPQCIFTCTSSGWKVTANGGTFCDATKGYSWDSGMEACVNCAANLCQASGGVYNNGNCTCDGRTCTGTYKNYKYCAMQEIDGPKHMCQNNTWVRVDDVEQSYNVPERSWKANFDACLNPTSSATMAITPADTFSGASSEESISDLAGRLAKVEGQFGLSKWRTAEGKFNTARLASDLTAGVVLGTTGALVTSSVIKKKQVKDGFESLECTVGGQHVGDWGDVFRIDGK